MSYYIDKNLQKGMELLASGKKKDCSKAISLINTSAIKGETKGKSYFEIARIIREGAADFSSNPEEARRYYDAAMEHFLHSDCDSMDHREMGDYYYYGLGTCAADNNRALQYYDLASSEGDELAKQRAAEIRGLQLKGTNHAVPTLSPETEVKEEKTALATVEFPENIVVEAAPVVSSDGKEANVDDAVVADVVDKEQLTIKAIRMLDSSSSNEQDKLDAIELLKTAADNGSVRAAVLLGYLYEGDNSLVELDYVEAKKYYEMAIDLGSSTALFRLGVLLADKDTPYYDAHAGHEMIVESARKGYSFALIYIGDCFRVKVTDERNLDLAYRYYCLAGERGLGLGYHYMSEIDASRQQLNLSKEHEKLAIETGYDPAIGYQDPLFYSLHI